VSRHNRVLPCHGEHASAERQIIITGSKRTMPRCAGPFHEVRQCGRPTERDRKIEPDFGNRASEIAPGWSDGAVPRRNLQFEPTSVWHLFASRRRGDLVLTPAEFVDFSTGPRLRAG